MGGPEARSRGFKKNKVEAQKNVGGQENKVGGSKKQGGWSKKPGQTGGQKTRVPIRKAKTHPNSSMSNCPMFPTGLLLTMM